MTEAKQPLPADGATDPDVLPLRPSVLKERIERNIDELEGLENKCRPAASRPRLWPVLALMAVVIVGFVGAMMLTGWSGTSGGDDCMKKTRATTKARATAPDRENARPPKDLTPQELHEWLTVLEEAGVPERKGMKPVLGHVDGRGKRVPGHWED